MQRREKSVGFHNLELFIIIIVIIIFNLREGSPSSTVLVLVKRRAWMKWLPSILLKPSHLFMSLTLQTAEELRKTGWVL